MLTQLMGGEIGDVEGLEGGLAAMAGDRRATAGNKQITLTIAAGYGGREEIADAVRALLTSEAAEGLSPREVAALVSPEAISRHLYMPALPDLDLIIRTSGEVRISGFMLWQSIYSELYVADVNWPDFRRIDLLRAVRTYQGRQRRFGAPDRSAWLPCSPWLPPV